MKFVIDKNDLGKRLDKFLVEKMPGLSRSQIQKKIQAGEVLVNGKIADVHKFLKENDEISVGAGLAPAQSRVTTRVAPTISDMTIEPKIIFEDKDFLVIEKPSGMLVHGVGAYGRTPLQHEPTLVDWLLKKYPEIKNVGEEKYREGIIHRLDKDVSGVMLAAKTQTGFSHLKQQFKERKVTKTYLALVYGAPSEHEGKIDLPIGRSAEGKFVAHPRAQNAKFHEKDKHAITLYRLMNTTRDYSLLEIKILTGRTHQIRAHLSAIGHPIVGDSQYGPKKPFFKKFSKKIKVLNTPRIFLHSHKIGFYNMQNVWVEFESPMPKELEEFLSQLK